MGYLFPSSYFFRKVSYTNLFPDAILLPSGAETQVGQ